MSYVKEKFYCDMPFVPETRRNNFYTYSNIKNLITKCERHKDKVINCRTIGVLQSSYGRFTLTDMDLPLTSQSPVITLSLVYLKDTQLKSTVMPSTVQLFGMLQWKRQPVLYVKILEVLKTEMAIRMKNILHSIEKIHLPSDVNEYHKNIHDDADFVSHSDVLCYDPAFVCTRKIPKGIKVQCCVQKHNKRKAYLLL